MTQLRREHHRHREARPRLADGSDQLAAYLRDGRERVFHPRSRPRDARVPPLLAFGQRLVALSFALDLIPKAVRLQPGRPLLGRIAAIGIDVAARVARVEDASISRIPGTMRPSSRVLRQSTR